MYMELMEVGMMHHSSFISSFKLIVLRTVPIACVLAIVVSFVTFYNRITFTGSTSYELYYDYPKNSVDVVFLGSSHVYKGINPVVLWDDYGIRAMDMGTGSQPIWATYSYLQEVLKTQTPELVVLDVYVLGYQNFTNGELDTHTAGSYIGIRPSVSKFVSFWDSTQNILKLEDGFNWNLFWIFPYNHSKYKLVQMRNYKNDIKYHLDSVLGFNYSTDVVPVGQPYEYDPDTCTKVTPCTKDQERYLRSAIELCESRNIPILLTNTVTMAISDDRQSVYNYVQSIADEYGVQFVNACRFYDEIGIDNSLDYLDAGNHLSFAGANKYTKWLADNYILKYNITARQADDPKSRAWVVSSNALREKVVSNEVHDMTSSDEILKKLDTTPGISYIVIDRRPGQNMTVFIDEGTITSQYDNASEFHHVQPYDDWNLRVISDGITQRVEIDKQERLVVEAGEFGLVVYAKDCSWFTICDLFEIES